MAKTVRISLAVLAAFLLAAWPSGASAHGMVITRDGQTLTVRYDNQTPAARSLVTLYNHDEQMIWEGKVDSEGRLQLPVLEFSRAVADDGLGHQQTHIPGQVQRMLPKPLAAALGISFLLFIAALSRYVSQIKEKKLT
jgi:hypothetical protein